MTDQERKNKISEMMDKLEGEFGKVYQLKRVGGKTFFNTHDEELISIACVPLNESDPFFVIEYGDGEDGDRFYPSDYTDLSVMAKAMIEEIEADKS